MGGQDFLPTAILHPSAVLGYSILVRKSLIEKLMATLSLHMSHVGRQLHQTPREAGVAAEVILAQVEAATCTRSLALHVDLLKDLQDLCCFCQVRWVSHINRRSTSGW